MVHFKKILVCIDFSDMDEALIQYAQVFMQKLKADSLTFIHIVRKSQSSGFFSSDKDNFPKKSVETLKDDIQIKVGNFIKSASFTWEIDILEGDINDQIHKAIEKHNADLLIMGRKQELKDSEGLPKRTVKKSGCAVLLIPESPVKEIKKVLVPVDFSEYSGFAIKTALDLSGESGKVFCQHVYFVPSGYHKTGKDHHEFANIMEANAMRDTKDFMKKYKLPEDRISFTYTLDDNNDPADKVVNYAKKISTNLIIMGSKGRTGAAAIMLGSVAESIVKCNDLYPLLVIKRKNENLGFFDTIFKM